VPSRVVTDPVQFDWTFDTLKVKRVLSGMEEGRERKYQNKHKETWNPSQKEIESISFHQ
jgi:hypothetical protein